MYSIYYNIKIFQHIFNDYLSVLYSILKFEKLSIHFEAKKRKLFVIKIFYNQ